MSTSLPRPSRRRSRGHTLVEITVVLAISTLLGIGLNETVGRAIGAHKQLLVADMATRMQQKSLGKIRSAAFSAVRVLGADSVGSSIFAALDTAGLTPLAGTRLPVLDTSGRLAEDVAGAARTGNALLLAVEGRPIDVAPNGTLHRLDRVRFVAFYLTRLDEQVVAGQNDRLDVVQFTSRAYVLQSGVDAITDSTEQKDVLLALRAMELDRLVTLDVDAAAAFRDVSTLGVVGSSAVVDPVIDADDRFPVRRLLFGRPMSVANNGAPIGVPRFALPDPDAPDFPGGLEVKVAGPWAARRVLVRLALVGGGAGSHDVVSDVTKVFTVGAR